MNLETIRRRLRSVMMADVPFARLSVFFSRLCRSLVAEEEAPVVWSREKKKTKIKMLGFLFFSLRLSTPGWGKTSKTYRQQYNEKDGVVYFLFLISSEHDGVPDDLLNVHTGSACMRVVEKVLTERTPTATIDFTPNFVGELEEFRSLEDSQEKPA